MAILILFLSEILKLRLKASNRKEQSKLQLRNSTTGEMNQQSNLNSQRDFQQEEVKIGNQRSIAASPAESAWLSRWLMIERVLSAEGPRSTRILGNGKNRVTRKSRLWDCTNDSTNTEFPHLRIHRPKST